jgi:hypothetical protein
MSSLTTDRRPASALWVFALLLILGIGALGGGIAMITGVGGESMLPDAYLEDLPLIDNWVVPGLILAIGFGLGSLLTAYGVWRRPQWARAQRLVAFTRHHWAWLATLLLGVGQVAWITIEVVSIPFSFLMPTFGLVGLALSLLPLTPSFRHYLADRGPEPVSTPSREYPTPVPH